MYMVVRAKSKCMGVRTQNFFLHITCELSNYKVHIQQFRMMTALFFAKSSRLQFMQNAQRVLKHVKRECNKNDLGNLVSSKRLRRKISRIKVQLIFDIGL